MSDVIYGLNPVRELLRSGTPIDKAYVSKHKGPAAALAMQLREQGVPVKDCDDRRLDDICGKEDGQPANHQGIAVLAAAAEYSQPEDIFAAAEEQGRPPLIVLLDGITDPHNMGAIIRSAEAMGAHGIIFGQRRSASLGGTVFKASSGAAAHICVCRVGNLAATVDMLKKRNVWVCGADAGAKPCYMEKLTGPLAICIGSEGEGLSRLVREKCDFLAGIPLSGKTESLNASCAASILLYEAARQRAGG